jgi:preprotein translocase subunit SecA
LLDLFAEMVDRDPEYHDRLVRYYTMWKRVVDDPSHPDHGKIRSAEPGDGILRRAPPRRRSEPRVGANAPCPCGSGRKFKKCLRDRPADRHGDLRV